MCSHCIDIIHIYAKTTGCNFPFFLCRSIFRILQWWLLFEAAFCTRDAPVGEEAMNTVSAVVLSRPVGACVPVPLSCGSASITSLRASPSTSLCRRPRVPCVPPLARVSKTCEGRLSKLSMAASVHGWFCRSEADRTQSTRRATEEANWSRAPKGMYMPASFPSKSHPAVSAPRQWGKYGIGLQRCVPSPHVPTLAAAWCRYKSPSAFQEAARSLGVPSWLASPPTPAAYPCRRIGTTPLTPCAGTACWTR
jgi:hypothetical protein